MTNCSPAPLVPSAAFRSQTRDRLPWPRAATTRSIRPAVAATAQREQAAAAGREQRVLDARRAQADARAIERVALADRRRGSVRSPAGRNSPEPSSRPSCTAPKPTARAPQSPQVGQASFPQQEAPAAAERHRCDVKTPLGLLVKPLAGREQVDQDAAERQRAGRPRGDSRWIVLVAEHAQLVFQPVDLVERGFRRRHEGAIPAASISRSGRPWRGDARGSSSRAPRLPEGDRRGGAEGR